MSLPTTDLRTCDPFERACKNNL